MVAPQPGHCVELCMTKISSLLGHGHVAVRVIEYLDKRQHEEAFEWESRGAGSSHKRKWSKNQHQVALS